MKSAPTGSALKAENTNTQMHSYKPGNALTHHMYGPVLLPVKAPVIILTLKQT